MIRYVLLFASLCVSATFAVDALEPPHKFNKGDYVVNTLDKNKTILIIRSYSSSLEGDTLYEVEPLGSYIKGENEWITESLLATDDTGM